MKGILLVDKPTGLTSHDVVDRIRKAAGLRRVGHTGTLDPAATGLLVLCLGIATRLSEHLTGLEKEYEGTLQLGVATDTHDRDGRVLEEHPVPDLTDAAIQDAFDKFTGPILQTPPMVSAVKVGGERLYKIARKGGTVPRAPRPIIVHEFVALGYAPPLVTFRMRCTSGTYVRTLCDEVGRVLGCGGMLAALRRTAVGPHSVQDALPLDAFQDPESVARRLLPMEKALMLPEAIIHEACRSVVLTGGTIMPHDLKTPCPVQKGWIQLKSPKGRLLALAQVTPGPGPMRIHAKRVLVEPES